MKTISIIATSIFVTFFYSSVYARTYVQGFVPTMVTVSDGYLQIRSPNQETSKNNACKENTLAIPDDHKYVAHYLSLATAALLARKELQVGISDSICAGGTNKWPLIETLILTQLDG